MSGNIEQETLEDRVTRIEQILIANNQHEHRCRSGAARTKDYRSCNCWLIARNPVHLGVPTPEGW